MSYSEPLDPAFIKAVFERSLEGRVYNNSLVCSAPDIAEKIERWRAEGSTIVFTAGVFDLMHINHLLALHHYRLLGAYHYLERTGQGYDKSQLIRVAASDRVRLVVTIDSDARADAMKGRVPSKAYSPRPILSWQNRTLLVAKQVFENRPLADIVTVHGEKSCPDDTCPHIDDVALALFLKPDIVPVSSNSIDTINRLAHSPLATNLVAIDEDVLAYDDVLIGGPVKTSAIIRRSKS